MTAIIEIIYDYIYTPVLTGLIEMPFFNIDIAFGTSLINLGEIVSALVVFSVVAFLVYLPIKIISIIGGLIKR